MLTRLFDQLSIKHIFLIALVARIVAALFSQGYGMHDDHFLVVEVAEAWTHGIDVADWFVTDFNDNTSGRSIFYPGLHYILFEGLDVIGLSSLEAKMYVVRLLHALYSMSVVWLCYKLALLWGNARAAKAIALMVGILWCLPYYSVRNLAEVVAIPPMLWATYLMLKDNKQLIGRSLLAGLMLGFAFSFRYQTIIFTGGFLLGLLILKRVKSFTFMSIAGLLWIGLFHGYGDYLACGVPFGKVYYYIDYNIHFSSDYIELPWFQYFLVVVAFLVPPVGAFLFIGTWKTTKDKLPVVLAVGFFFFVHSIFKGKQERFMFTLLPFFITLGYLGWLELKKGKNWKWLKYEPKIWAFCFWVNCLGLIFLSTWYSKKARVETMSALYGKDVKGIIVANENRDGVNMLPMAYSGSWYKAYNFTSNDSIPSFVEMLKSKPDSLQPNYLIIEHFPDEETQEFAQKWQKEVKTIALVEAIEGSLIDRTHYKMNRIVKNDDYTIYKIEL